MIYLCFALCLLFLSLVELTGSVVYIYIYIYNYTLKHLKELFYQKVFFLSSSWNRNCPFIWHLDIFPQLNNALFIFHFLPSASFQIVSISLSSLSFPPFLSSLLFIPSILLCISDVSLLISRWFRALCIFHFSLHYVCSFPFISENIFNKHKIGCKCILANPSSLAYLVIFLLTVCSGYGSFVLAFFAWLLIFYWCFTLWILYCDYWDL